MKEILIRRSVRDFNLSNKIELEDLKYLCECAEAAPSSRRQNSREYIIIDDEDLIYEISQMAAPAAMLQNCNTLIAVIGKDPVDLISPNMQDQDLAAATENILVAATHMGYGSCWIAVHPYEDREKYCKELLDIPGEGYVFCFVALGYPESSDCFYDSKKIADTTIHINKYNNA